MACHLVIDRVKCENNGYCMAAAPTLIQLAGDGRPLLLDTVLAPEQEGIARLAVASCPMGALLIKTVAPSE